ncbi:MAG: nucleotidyltransferase domain-containing protein [Sedimentisphaerales bacterium]|nr:nucleotidyltransferase domain-containing protein [Sedimentisphaerales bacterium]
MKGMILVSEGLQKIVKSCAEEFGVKTVWLFGSALEDEEHARDYDLAVEGIEPTKFFKFYSKLYFSLSKPVDLVDMSLDPPIAFIVRDQGVRIYER